MFGTVAYNQEPVEGPEENPVLREARLRNWIRKQTLKEESLNFNNDFKPVRGPFHPLHNKQFDARHDSDFLLPDAFNQLMPVPKQPELHGLYSSPMIGSTVPGYVDPRLKNIGLVNNSDLVPNNLERGTGSISSVPRMPGVGDKLSDERVLGAIKKMLFKGTADDKDLEARQMDSLSGRPWRGQ